MRSYFFRPSLLLALSAAVVAGALVVVFQRPTPQGRPTPLPIAEGEREIVWLYPATNATSWERFVAALRRTAERLHDQQPAWQIDANAAFPRQTTAVPELSLFRAAGPRFVFRWYKLTSDWKTRDWIEALLKRQPPPLAIIGGSSSDGARELATHLHHFSEALPAEERPLLLLTTATADLVSPYGSARGDRQRAINPHSALQSRPSPGESRKPITEPPSGVNLTRLYPGRTFRFCFTNKQMAAAVSNFIWWRDDLRPNTDPVYMATWHDDSYSRDLIDGFWDALRQVTARDAATKLLWPASQLLFSNCPPFGGGGVFPVQRLRTDFRDPFTASTFSLALPPTPYVIDSSVGSFATPNHYEAKAAGDMLDSMLKASPVRPLLIVAGQSQPSRRFLRGLVRGVPSLSKRAQIVVATGDAISFNTVYRDRQVAWNIQDLPFPLVFFCHRNPIAADAGFRPGSDEGDRSDEERNSTAETGTEDVLLYGDIIEALLQTGAPADRTPCAHAAELAERLAEARLRDEHIVLGGGGIRLFNKEGQRQSGTGEHVVCLLPTWHPDSLDRLLPRATLEVWEWRRRDWSRGERGQHWQRRGKPLIVSYSDLPN